MQFWVFTGRCFCWKLPAGNLSWCIPVDALGQRSCGQEQSWHRAIFQLCVQGQEGAQRWLLVEGGLLPPEVLKSVNNFIARQAQVLWCRAQRNRTLPLRWGGGHADLSPPGGQPRQVLEEVTWGKGSGGCAPRAQEAASTRSPGRGSTSTPAPRGSVVSWPLGWWPVHQVCVCPWSPRPPQSSQGQAEDLHKHTNGSPSCRWLPAAQSLL